MTLEEAVQLAIDRARNLRLDPQVTISEVYEAELLRRLQRSLRGGVVWKGGTVLRLEGSERFSRDLDATRRQASLSRGRLENTLRQAAEDLTYLVDLAIEARPRSLTATYRFAVPGVLQPLRLVVEISLREKVLRLPGVITTARIAQPYGLEPVVVSRLDPAELLAEKFRALVTRGASRDIYDIYWLLQQGAEADAPLFLKKMAYYQTVGWTVEPEQAVKATIRRLRSYNHSRAKTELANLLPAAQRTLDFTVIVEEVRRTMERLARVIADLGSP